jgi:hypothetical protein
VSSAKTYVDIIGRDKTKAATKSAVGNMQKLEAAGQKMAASLAPLAGGAALAGFASMIKGQIDAADSIQKMSLQLQVSTEALSQYKHVADITGTSFETITKGIRYMQKNMSDAEDGLSTARRAFAELRLEVGNLRQLRPEEQFELIGQRLSEIEDPARRTQVAMNVFGRAGAELNQTFADGADAVRLLREEADRLGLTLTKDAADKAAEANDAITRLEASFSGLGRTLATVVAPALSSAADAMNGFIEEARTFAETGDAEGGFEVWLRGLGKVNPGLATTINLLGLVQKATDDATDSLEDLQNVIEWEQLSIFSENLGAWGRVAEDSAPKVTALATATKDFTDALTLDDELQYTLDAFNEYYEAVEEIRGGLQDVEEEGSRSMEVMEDSARGPLVVCQMLLLLPFLRPRICLRAWAAWPGRSLVPFWAGLFKWVLTPCFLGRVQ